MCEFSVTHTLVCSHSNMYALLLKHTCIATCTSVYCYLYMHALTLVHVCNGACTHVCVTCYCDVALNLHCTFVCLYHIQNYNLYGYGCSKYITIYKAR